MAQKIGSIQPKAIPYDVFIKRKNEQVLPVDKLMSIPDLIVPVNLRSQNTIITDNDGLTGAVQLLLNNINNSNTQQSIEKLKNILVNREEIIKDAEPITLPKRLAQMFVDSIMALDSKNKKTNPILNSQIDLLISALLFQVEKNGHPLCHALLDICKHFATVTITQYIEEYLVPMASALEDDEILNEYNKKQQAINNFLLMIGILFIKGRENPKHIVIFDNFKIFVVIYTLFNNRVKVKQSLETLVSETTDEFEDMDKQELLERKIEIYDGFICTFLDNFGEEIYHIDFLYTSADKKINWSFKKIIDEYLVIFKNEINEDTKLLYKNIHRIGKANTRK